LLRAVEVELKNQKPKRPERRVSTFEKAKDYSFFSFCGGLPRQRIRLRVRSCAACFIALYHFPYFALV
jgi:hypothetical protein